VRETSGNDNKAINFIGLVYVVVERLVISWFMHGVDWVG